MRDDEYDTTIGTGGWLLVGLSGVVTFAVLRGLLDYHIVPSALFALAIALIVVLVLYRLASAVNRYDDAEEARRVRKIVPASGQGVTRVSGVEGASAASAMAVPVRPDPATPVPVRPSSVVTPLARVEPALILAPPPMSAPKPVTPVVAAAEALVAAAGKSKAAKPKATQPKADMQPEMTEKPAAKPKVAKPAAKPKAAKAAKPVGLLRLTAPRGGQADDLKEIEGIGPALEKMVNGMGFYHFDQIAGWTDADIALVDAEMKTFKGRITRDKWVAQARIIVSEGLEAFRERAKTNDY